MRPLLFCAFALCGTGLLVLRGSGGGEMPVTPPAVQGAALAFELPDQTGIIEGIAWRSATDDYFFGDVHRRCVWRRDRSGRLTRFSAPGELLYGVFGLKVDERRHVLWAATSMLPEAGGFSPADKGHAALVALDLTTGRIVQTCAIPPDRRDHVLGDLLLAPDGTVYLTDSLAPVIWRRLPGSSALEPFVESAAFRSLQGLVLVDHDRKLLVSDYAHGLFTVDLARRDIRPLTAPSGTDLRGLDGLLVRGKEILAVYNAREPNRIVRITFPADASKITGAEALSVTGPGFNDLTLITLAGSHPQVVANAGWALVDSRHPADIAAHPVRIFELP